MFYPRTKTTLYKVILKGLRLWARPPHDHCDHCAKWEKTRHRLFELTPALLAYENDPGYRQSMELLDLAGGREKANTEKRDLEKSMEQLTQHVFWRDNQRNYVKLREVGLLPSEAIWYLDYGGFSDSANKKVSAWSSTVVTKDNMETPEHFDFFFDAANQNTTDKQKKGAKKSGSTGVFHLSELLDPAKSPDGKVSLMKQHFPLVNHLILSGDTGNGFRGYEMLEELSSVFVKYGYSVELIPLGPGHAWNRTDSRFAHMNTFIKKLKGKSRVFGAKGFADAFWAASDVSQSTRRQFMSRSHIFFRVVPSAPAGKNKNFGAQLQNKMFEDGHAGVRKLLYYNFSFDGPGGLEYPVGYARVRKNGDPAVANNPTLVYTWNKDLALMMCQARVTIRSLSQHTFNSSTNVPFLFFNG